MRKFLLASFILVFPIAGYFLLQTGKNHFKPLPFFGPKTLTGTFHTLRRQKIADTSYFVVPDFTLLNQDSVVVHSKALVGSIYVASLFYTRSGGIAGPVTEAMDSLSRLFVVHPDIHFFSLSLDWPFDRPSVLKSYQKVHRFTSPKWDFLTGPADQVYQLAREGFLLNAVKSSDSVIAFNPLLVLVDTKRHIRGYYQATRPDEVKRLRDEIIVLRLEEMRKVTDLVQH